MNRSESRFVQSAIDFKSWISATPSVDQLRPGSCPACGTASRPPGKALALHGHGKRERQLWGPVDPEAPPEVTTIFVRRYLCQRCDAVITVGPKAVLRKRLYSAGAVGLAFALWALSGLSAPEVRKLIKPGSAVGAAAARTWLTLRRWARDLPSLFVVVRPCPAGWTPRRAAGRAATTLASLAPESSHPLTYRAFYGASG